MTTLFRVVAGLTGAVVAIESLVLFVGTHWVVEDASDWVCLKNDAFVVLDVIVGASLVYFAFRGSSGPLPLLFYGLVGVALLAHGYRIWEWQARVERPFFFNVPLLVFNLVRLLGLVASGVLAVMLQRWRG